MTGADRESGPLQAAATDKAADPSSGRELARQGHDAMSGETLQRRVTITNPQGFHMRPQSVFARLANRFASTVTVSNGSQRANGKSQWELMLLAAEQGSELLLEVAGPDAQAALDALSQVLAAPSADDTPEPPLPKKG